MTLDNSTIILHYFALENCKSSFCFGEFPYLLLLDSGLPFEYIRHPGSEWKTLRQKQVDQHIYAATLPVLELDGQLYCKSIPIMRLIAAKLGKYGATQDAAAWHYLDHLSDTCMDWYNTVQRVYFPVPILHDQVDAHIEDETKKYLAIFDKVFDVHGGPYIMGNEISYVDFIVYHVMDDDFALKHVENYPNVARFVNAFEKRPNIAKRIADVKQEVV
ncbi:class gamma glutathione S-transferase [Gongronella butleri]|nr:class gamma glutathione S-transferase [Gongronella butleri]